MFRVDRWFRYQITLGFKCKLNSEWENYRSSCLDTYLHKAHVADRLRLEGNPVEL